MRKPWFRVSDRAVIRYLEHVLGHDIAALRREISARAERDGADYRIAGRTITNIIPKKLTPPESVSAIQRRELDE
ncbi:hypothetical protein ACXN5S_12445 [Pseudoroseicyclus sp. H15]